jgi:hypothetical protein
MFDAAGLVKSTMQEMAATAPTEMDTDESPGRHPAPCPACGTGLSCNREWAIHVEGVRPANVYLSDQMPAAETISRVETRAELLSVLPRGIYATRDAMPMDPTIKQLSSYSSVLPDDTVVIDDIHDYECDHDHGDGCTP